MAVGIFRDTYQSFDTLPEASGIMIKLSTSFSVPELVACLVVALRVYLGYDRARRGRKLGPRAKSRLEALMHKQLHKSTACSRVCMKTR